MSEVKFKDLLFDPDITPFHDLAKAMAGGFGYTADLKVDKLLAQLLRLRVAQYNECSYCVILHAKTAREVGICEAKVDNISSWWQSELYSEQEKVALNYCDRLTEGRHPNFKEVHDSMLEYFSAVEIAEMAAIIINMNVWTRLKMAQGQVPYYA